MSTEQRKRGRQAEAERNNVRILEAAREVFIVGQAAPISQVALRAGVASPRSTTLPRQERPPGPGLPRRARRHHIEYPLSQALASTDDLISIRQVAA